MARLGDICKFQSGGTPSKNDDSFFGGQIPWITTVALSGSVIDGSAAADWITEKAVAKSAAKIVPANSIMVGARVGVGKVAINTVPMSTSQDIISLVDIDESIYYKPYICDFILSKGNYLNSQARGATIKGIKIDILAGLDIPNLSIGEQRHIAAVLDKVSDLIALRKQQLAKLDELVKARFVEMFGDPVANEKRWPIASIGEVAEVKIGPFGSLLHKEDYIEGIHALVNPSHIVDDKICVDNKLSVTREKYEELSAYHLMPGDVVLGRRGEMGRCAVVYREGLLCGTGSMILRVDGRIIRPYFLQAILSSPTYKRYIEDKAVGVTMQNLNVPIVSSLLIPLYPPEKQVEYINLLYHTDMEKNTIRKSNRALETLKSALMQEYFG